MNAQELYDEWTSGETNGMRPARVQAIRGDLEAATGLNIPHRTENIEGWLQAMHESGTITKKLKQAAEETVEHTVEVEDDPDDGE